MPFRLIWSSFSEEQLFKIHDFYSEEANEEVALKIINGIIEAAERLRFNPKLGPIEGMLAELPTSYRYTLYKNFKIIYSVEKELLQIRVADVFDCRQSPSKITQGK